MVSDFLAALIESMGLDTSIVGDPGVSVAADASRNDSGVTACYSLGEHHVIWAPEWAVEHCKAFSLGPGDGLAQFRSFCEATEGEFLGTGVMRVFDELSPPTMPEVPDKRVVELMAASAEDNARIAALCAACDPDDVDEADIDLDAPDPVIHCINRPNSDELASYASARPWEDTLPRWWDIGVLTHPEHRRQGLSVPCVAEVVRGVLAADGEPLYRHDKDNVASAGVAAKMGFVVATELLALRLDSSKLG